MGSILIIFIFTEVIFSLKELLGKDLPYFQKKKIVQWIVSFMFCYIQARLGEFIS